jgi:hypothetical protein
MADQNYKDAEVIVTTLAKEQCSHSASLIERGRKISSRLRAAFSLPFVCEWLWRSDGRIRNWPPCRFRLQMQ